MKKLLVIAGLITVVALVSSCGGAEGNDPGRVYMPDMNYSRAYESFGYYNSEESYKNLKRRGINYSATPVNGTIARGDMPSYHLTNDSAGVAAADALRNPFDTVAISKDALKEGERLYLVHCGICHGAALNGNGPLFNGGNGPYPAAPKNLVSDEAKAWSDGHYYHVITYGKGQMGSYASQLHPEQRWWVTEYIRSKQGPAAAATPAAPVAGGQTQTPAASTPTGPIQSTGAATKAPAGQ